MLGAVRNRLFRPQAGEGTPAGRILAFVEGLFVAISVLALICLTLVICVSVLGRNFFGQPVPDDLILVENLMPLIICLPFAYVAARRGNIEVDIFTSAVPPRGICLLNALGNLIGVLIFSAIAWFTYGGVMKDLASQQYYEGALRIPLWPAKAVFVLAMVFFAIRLAINFLGDLRRARRGDLPAEHAPDPIE